MKLILIAVVLILAAVILYAHREGRDPLAVLRDAWAVVKLRWHAWRTRRRQ